MQLSRKLIVIIIITLGILSIIALGLRLWKEEPLSYGLVYLHPVGNWTHMSRIHWLGSPSQFSQVNGTGAIESDLAKISKAGYKSVLFQTCIACLEPYTPYPDDFDNDTVLKQNVKWIADKAKEYGLEVYVLYYPDCRPDIGDYYDEGSENWNLTIDFAHWCNSTPSIDYCAPFSLTHNKTEVEYFFEHLGTNNPKILMHADQPFIKDLMPLNYPKLLEIYNETDEDLISRVKDANEHIITGQARNKILNQSQQVDLINEKLSKLGRQKDFMIWCYADYPDSSYPEDLGLVQTSDETLPLSEAWKQICMQSFNHSLFFMKIIKTSKAWKRLI